MYKERVNAVKSEGFVKNVIVPILVAFFILVGLGAITELLPGVLITETNPSSSTNLSSLLTMIGNVLIGALIIRFVTKWKFSDLGWHKDNICKSYIKGSIIGIVAITISFLLSLILGSISVEYVFTKSSLVPFLITFAFYVFQGTYEELVFRSYLMPFFSKYKGNIFAVGFTALLFAMIHGLNENFSTMGFINLLIFGTVFGLGYLRTGSLWLVGAAHTFWNFFLGNVYGSNVSGIVSSDSILISKTVGTSTLLNGGKYGLEGSIITSIIGLILIYVLLNLDKFKTVK